MPRLGDHWRGEYLRENGEGRLFKIWREKGKGKEDCIRLGLEREDTFHRIERLINEREEFERKKRIESDWTGAGGERLLGNRTWNSCFVNINTWAWYFVNLPINLIFSRYPTVNWMENWNKESDTQIKSAIQWISRSVDRNYDYPTQKFPAQEGIGSYKGED